MESSYSIKMETIILSALSLSLSLSLSVSQENKEIKKGNVSQFCPDGVNIKLVIALYLNKRFDLIFKVLALPMS